MQIMQPMEMICIKILKSIFDKPVSSAHAHSLNEVKQNIEQSLIQQFSLHGDPAIKLNYYKGHDYTLDPKSLKPFLKKPPDRSR